MTMWRVKRRGRSIGALTLGGGGGRERREVAGITRALGGEARKRSTKSTWLRVGDGTKRDGGGRKEMCAMRKGRHGRKSITGGVKQTRSNVIRHFRNQIVLQTHEQNTWLKEQILITTPSLLITPSVPF
jgi:hypothetical protein